MSGAGLAADTINSGRLFVATGNGAFNAAPPYSNSMSYGDDLIRLETSTGAMRLAINLPHSTKITSVLTI
jgi:hypothetical protein